MFVFWFLPEWMRDAAHTAMSEMSTTATMGMRLAPIHMSTSPSTGCT